MDFESILNFVIDSPKRIHLTFDDGNTSDYLIAAPRLRTLGLDATFFVLAGRIGEEGYLCESHIQQLSNEGFEIGSHGLNHIAWIHLGLNELRRELEKSKAILEAITGRTIYSVSIPFGAYNRNVIRELKRQGFRNIFSSDGSMRLTTAVPTPRFTVKKGFDIPSLSKALRKATGLTSRVTTEMRVRLKTTF
jgi:peptidoglycan/xylan/chitin deacetylase (PgdA/CDA1 family)